MRIEMEKAGTEKQNGRLQGKYKKEFNNNELVAWTDIKTYKCPECRVVIDCVSCNIMEHTCSRHTNQNTKYEVL